MAPLATRGGTRRRRLCARWHHHPIRQCVRLALSRRPALQPCGLRRRNVQCHAQLKVNRHESATLDCDAEFQGAHRVLWQLQSTFSLQVACAAPAPNSRSAHLYCSSARPKPAGAAVQYASTTCTAESDAHLWEAAHGGAHVNALESLSSCAKGSAGTHRAGGTQHTRLLVHGTAGVTIPTPEA